MENRNINNVVVINGNNENDFDKNAKLYFELKRKIENLVNDSEFLGWLEIFTLYNPNFSDNNFVNFSDGVSEYDKYMVSQLSVLYKAISDFLSFIGLSNLGYKSKNLNEGEYYSIVHNGVLYEIGKIDGQEPIFFCNRVNGKIDGEFISFNDILHNQKTEFIDEVFAIDPERDSLSVYPLKKPYYKRLGRCKKNEVFRKKIRLYNYRKK